MVKGLSIKKFILLITAIVTFILFWVVFGITNAKINGLRDQQMYERWAPEGGYAQISVFMPESASVTPESLEYFQYSLLDALKKESIESSSENEGARLIASCYTANGSISVRSAYANVNLLMNFEMCATCHEVAISPEKRHEQRVLLRWDFEAIERCCYDFFHIQSAPQIVISSRSRSM